MLNSKRNLLTVILSAIIAVLLAVGISFMLPKNEKTAQAAAAINSFTYTNTFTGSLNTGTNYSGDQPRSAFTGSGYITGTPNGGSFSKNNDMNCISGYSAFQASISVPAMTEYTVDFTASIYAYKKLASGGSVGFNTDFYYFGSDSSSSTTGSTNSNSVVLGCYQGSATSPVVDSKRVSTGGVSTNPYTVTTSHTVRVVYTNNSNTAETYTAYFGYLCSTGRSGSSGSAQTVNSSVSVTDTITVTPLALPTVTGGLTTTPSSTATAEYDPSGTTFNFVYDTDRIALSSVSAVDANSAAIGGPSPTIDSSGNCTLTAAGTYTFYFDITSGSVWAPGGTDQATKTVTVTIKRKQVTVPTVTDTPQTYDPAGCHFSLDSNFDATIMTPSGVTSGITWNVASSKFDATDAGTYTVKFTLDDKDNYEWNVGSGTTADQTKTVKIEHKKLTIPTITAPQEYTGSALSFVLANFNSGTDIKVDSVTATNGSTVTGVSGAAITDTTDTFEATSVDNYTATLSLRDTTNFIWSDNTNTPKAIPFEITQKELLSSPPASSETNSIGGAEWAFGGSATITITDDRFTGDNLNLLIYYDSSSNVLTGTTTGNVTTITMPTTIAVGTHTLTVELNGTTGDNANYKITTNNTLSFEVTSGSLDPSNYGWIYKKDGAAGGTIADNGKLPFELKTGSSTDGVKYEVSIVIPSSDASKVAIDTSKYVLGYQTQSGSTVNTYVTTVALKSIDSSFTLDTTDIVLNWEIEKGTFDLSNVKWEYSLNGSSWAEYDSSNPPQYNDGNYVTVRVKSSTLPLGLTLDSLYTGMRKTDVDTYTATISASDLVYDTASFNAPDTSLMALSWEIAKKNLFNGFKNVRDTYSNGNGSGSYILKQLNVPTGFEGYILYKYYDENGVEVSLDNIKAAIDPTDEKQYKVEAYIDPAYAAKYEVSDGGSTPSDNFVTGSNNVLATATIDGNDGSTPITAAYDGNNHFDISVIKVTGDNGINVTDFTVTYYTGTTPTAGNELPAGEVPKNAGDYCILITLGSVAEDVYILATDTFTVKIEPKGIELPTLGEMTFDGNELKFEDYLGGTWNDYKSIIALDGKLTERNVGSGDYVTTLKLTDTNYKWIYPAATPATAAYTLTADGVSITGDDVIATYNWNISPLVIDTTKMWNKGSKGATLNLPQNVKDLIAGGTLELGYRYYDSEGNYVENPEIKGGRSFKVEAVFGGDDSVRNVQFKRSATELGSTSAGIDYTVPKSGAAVFFGNALSFLKRNWLWFLIALSILLFLIILICVIAHRRKTKEAREEKKAQKEEEKRRREEEREERRRKQEAELELQKAKQEAELAKMKAGLGVGMGAAGMAMAAQPVQQQMPIQQPQYQPQPQYSVNELAEMKADIRELKAQQRAGGYPQMPLMQMPMMQMPMPMSMPNYGPQMSGGGGMGSTSEVLITMLQNQLNEMRSGNADKEIAALRTQMELMKLQPQPQIAAPAKQEIPANTDNGEIEKFGAFAASLWRNMNSAPAPKEVAQTAEESKPVSVSYPPDAVVTTTTTVDTTKSKPEAPRSDDGRVFDLDGFYDTFDSNK